MGRGRVSSCRLAIEHGRRKLSCLEQLRLWKIWTDLDSLCIIMIYYVVFGCFWKQHETTTFVISCTFLCVVFVTSSLGSLPCLGTKAASAKYLWRGEWRDRRRLTTSMISMSEVAPENSMAWSSTDATTCSRDHDLVIQALKIIPSCKRYCCNLGHGVSASVCSTPLSMWNSSPARNFDFRNASSPLAEKKIVEFRALFQGLLPEGIVGCWRHPRDKAWHRSSLDIDFGPIWSGDLTLAQSDCYRVYQIYQVLISFNSIWHHLTSSYSFLNLLIYWDHRGWMPSWSIGHLSIVV